MTSSQWDGDLEALARARTPVCMDIWDFSIESRNGLHTLEHAEEIGLGSRAYQLVSIDQY